MAVRVGRSGRWTDRIEDLVAWVLLAVGLLAVLFGCVLGIGIHDRLIQQSRIEALDRTPTSATLLERAPTIASPYATEAPVGVHATWQDRSGTTHTGLVTAPQGLDADDTLPIWIDGSGAAVPAPTSSGDAIAVAAMVVGIVILGSATVLAALWAILRRILLAYNCAAWEREWREVAPMWSRGEGRCS